VRFATTRTPASDRIRCGKTTGIGRFPSRHFAINTVWLELDLTAIDLIAWTQRLLLNGELTTAEPRLRYRLLHAVGGAFPCGSLPTGPGPTN
jgi:hypothetical protein